MTDAVGELEAKWVTHRNAKVDAYESGDPRKAAEHAAKAEAYCDALELVDPAATDGTDDDAPVIRFADRHLDRIVEGKKTVTVRYDFRYDLYPGDPVRLATEAGTTLCEATVVTTCTLRADWVAYADFAGHRRYETTGELVDELAEYYPDAEIVAETPLDVIVFETGVTA